MKNLSGVLSDFGFKNVQMYGNDIAKVCDDFVFSSEKTVVDEKDCLHGENIQNSNKKVDAKCDDLKLEMKSGSQKGKLILVTAMTPNSHGVGKTTISIGLAGALNSMKKRTILALREPSMGPVFGVKGGGTGGGVSVLEPSEEIDLHFTGDFHAIAQANNLLSSVIDNHIFQGNELGIDEIFHKRCLDVNDRSLREISYEIRGKKYVTGFNITAASEVMAIVALSKNMQDLRQRLGQIMVGKNFDGCPVYAKNLGVEGAMVKLLQNAIKPNAVLSRGGSLALVHTGPFANIAHGASSVISLQSALLHSDFCVTEVGFGSDLGAEKFVNITSRELQKDVDVAVLAITVEGTKEHGCGSLEVGFENVRKHLQILRDRFNLNVVVAINKHKNDEEKDVSLLLKLCEKEGVLCEVCEPFEKGGEGCVDLAKAVGSVCESEGKVLKRTYQFEDSTKDKIEKIACEIYGAKRVEFSDLASEKLSFATKNAIEMPFLNMAKTPLSISDDKKLLGAPKDFTFHVRDIEFRTGAHMAVAIAGDMLLMPGLGKHSRYLDM